MSLPDPAHLRFETLLASALRATDPVLALLQACDVNGVEPSFVASLERADPDGVRLAALLIAKLRFERLLRGSDALGLWFERDPEAFTAAFRRYHQEVAPAVFWPAEEATAFEHWRAAQMR